jgi:phage tail sheath protein FI
MPEYLAPAVYVEEIDSGNKPIEGVSTITAGMIGVTERGPANVPILVTSYGEYVRWFGERLNRADFGDHCYLPHAVEGFFTNGGKRVFITRVEASGAARATFELHDRGDTNAASTVLLRTAPAGTGTAGNTPIYVLTINTRLASALRERRSNPARR